MKIKSKSFYDWCVENGQQYALDLWDYELNDLRPEEVNFKTTKKFYFKCPRAIHESEMYKISQVTMFNQKISCRKCHSFEQWCIDNNKQDYLDRWDHDLNDVDPIEVSISSGRKYYFKCPRELHDSELYTINKLTGESQQVPSCRKCKSLAQFGIDNIDKDFVTNYWSDKNNIDPFSIYHGTNKKIWVKCQLHDYHGSYLISAANFSKGKRCPFCAGKILHPKDTFGYRYEIAKEKWSSKNKKSCFDYPYWSTQKVFFVCEKHGEYEQSINCFINSNGVCPMCLKESNSSILQEKVNAYIEETYNSICLHEHNCTLKPKSPKTGRTLPYDIEIKELKLLIEVNGQQHYLLDGFSKLSAKKRNISPKEVLEDRKWKDEYKKDYALSHGYNFLEIPYWTDDKEETYKNLIDDKIKEIINKDFTSSLTTADDDEQSSP